MMLVRFVALTSMAMFASPAVADSAAVLDELSRLGGIDFEVTGVLTAGEYLGHDYRLSAPELGDFPAIIDGGRQLRQQVEESCQSAKGCEVTVTGRLEFDLPVVTFSIGTASSIIPREAMASPQDVFAKCWNVGALSSADLQENVTIAFEVIDGRPDAASIRYVRGSKPESEILGLYESARRAVIRCGASGTSLSDGTAEVTFDASAMILR